jgi:hypothetical protein
LPLLGALLALALAACDAGITEPAGGGNGQVTQGCTTDEPTEGVACAPVALECEFGSAPNPSCNDLWQCTDYGWTILPKPTPCPTTSAGCPASLAAVPAGGSCAVDNQLCEYPGMTCMCSDYKAGMATAGQPVWACTPTAVTCSDPRPHVGAPCSETSTGTSTVCNYGSCFGGVLLACLGGFWTLEACSE